MYVEQLGKTGWSTCAETHVGLSLAQRRETGDRGVDPLLAVEQRLCRGIYGMTVSEVPTP